MDKQPRIKYVASRINKDLLTRDANDNLMVRGLFTSDNKDMLGDVITRGATERAVPAFRQWGNIRYMHLPQPVGKVTRIGESDGLGWNEVEFVVLKEDVAKEVESGLLPALSVGILVDLDGIKFMDDGGWEINDYLLAEISLVDHPANYDAVLSRSINTEELRMPKNGNVVVIGDEVQKDVSVETVEGELLVKDVAITEVEEVEEVKDLEVEEVAETVEPEVEKELESEEPVAELEEKSIEEDVEEEELLEEEPIAAEPEVEEVAEVEEVELSIDEPIEEETEEPVFDAEKAIADLSKSVTQLTELVQTLAVKMAESGAEEVEEPSAVETKALEEPVVEQDEDEVVNRSLDVSETPEVEVEEEPLTGRERLRLALAGQLRKQGYK